LGLSKCIPPVHLHCQGLLKELHGDEQVAYGDAGFIGAGKRDELKGRKVEWNIARRRSPVEAIVDTGKRELARLYEHLIAKVRVKVEHPFRVIKRQFGPLTHWADARKALKRLDNEDIECLRRPEFRIKVPYRWHRGNIIQTEPIALLRTNLNLPEVSAVFYPDMVEPAIKTMENFYKAIRKVSFGIDIKPGRLLYIDNRFTLHSRDKLNDSFDKYQNPTRWIQRVFVSPNLWNHLGLTQVKSRVFQRVEAVAC